MHIHISYIYIFIYLSQIYIYIYVHVTLPPQKEPRSNGTNYLLTFVLCLSYIIVWRSQKARGPGKAFEIQWTLIRSGMFSYAYNQLGVRVPRWILLCCGGYLAETECFQYLPEAQQGIAMTKAGWLADQIKIVSQRICEFTVCESSVTRA